MIKFTILGKPATKKNSSRIIQCKGRPMLIPSKAYLDYERDALWQIPAEAKQEIDKPCKVTTVFYMPDNRRVDASNLVSAIHDILVKGRVIADDSRSIVSHLEAWCETDKENPRTEIEVRIL